MQAEGATCPDTLHVATTENGDDCHRHAVPGDAGAEAEMFNWLRGDL